MNKILMSVVVVFFIGCGWLFYEYINISKAAEQQVENDIEWVVNSFHVSTLLLNTEHLNKKHLKTQLMQQSVDKDNRFIRHYRSLFIRDGKKSCLESLLSYKNYQPVIQKQVWIAEGEVCAG